MGNSRSRQTVGRRRSSTGLLCLSVSSQRLLSECRFSILRRKYSQKHLTYADVSSPLTSQMLSSTYRNTKLGADLVSRISPPYTMMTFKFTSAEAVIYSAALFGMVGFCAVVWNSAYVFCRLRDRYVLLSMRSSEPFQDLRAAGSRRRPIRAGDSLLDYISVVLLFVND